MMFNQTAHLVFPCGARLPVHAGAFKRLKYIQGGAAATLDLCVYHTRQMPDRPMLVQYGCEALLPAPCISGCPAKGPHRKFTKIIDESIPEDDRRGEWLSMVSCQPLREESDG
jgi:hypothetical protein